MRVGGGLILSLFEVDVLRQMTRAVSSRWAVGRFPVSGAQWQHLSVSTSVLSVSGAQCQQHLSISNRAALAMENIVLSCTLYYCSTVQAHHIRLNICENLSVNIRSASHSIIPAPNVI